MVRRGLVRYGEAVGVWAGLVWRGDAGRSRWDKAGRGQARLGSARVKATGETQPPFFVVARATYSE